MSTNPIKAEKIINFGEKSYKARMSLDTIIRVEEALGCSVLKIGTKLTQADLTMTSEVIAILTLSVRAGGNDIKDNDIKEAVSKIGLVEAIKITGELLTLALGTGDSVSEKKTNL
jgi:hypothetical protein